MNDDCAQCQGLAAEWLAEAAVAVRERLRKLPVVGTVRCSEHGPHVLVAGGPLSYPWSYLSDYELGQRLTWRLERLGLSQTEISFPLAVTQAAVSAWCRGARRLPDDKVLRLLALWGLTADEFTSGNVDLTAVTS